jgi:hypothetical protein
MGAVEVGVEKKLSAKYKHCYYRTRYSCESVLPLNGKGRVYFKHSRIGHRIICCEDVLEENVAEAPYLPRINICRQQDVQRNW